MASRLILRIQERSARLTSSEKKIAQVLLRKQSLVETHTATELAALAGVSWEVDPGSFTGTAVDRFLDEPLARGLNGETAVDRFLDEPSDRGPAGENLWRRQWPQARRRSLQPQAILVTSN